MALIIYFYVPTMNKKDKLPPTPNPRLTYQPKVSFDKMQNIYLALCKYVSKNKFADFNKDKNAYVLKADILENMVNQKLLPQENILSDKGKKITMQMLQKQRRNFTSAYLIRVMGEKHIFSVLE